MGKVKHSKKKTHHYTPKQLMQMGSGLSCIDKAQQKVQANEIKEVEKHRAYLKSEISHVYEMSNSFITYEVKEYIDKKLAEEQELITRFPDAETLPYHITIGSYGYQDLAIALALSHVEKPEAWSYTAVIDLQCEDETQIEDITVSLNRTLPSMTHIEFLRGKKDCRIDVGHGLKTVGWAGFEKEILKELDSHKSIKDDSSIKQIEVELHADIKFINTAAYEEFSRITDWVNSGHEVAEKELRDLWVREQLAWANAKSNSNQGMQHG